MLYAQALGCNIKNPLVLIDGSDDVNLRKAIALQAPAVAKPTMGFDLKLVQDYLVACGSLRDCTTFEQLVPRCVLLARAFYGLRAADLLCLAHTIDHPLDEFSLDNLEHLDRTYRIPFYMTKTADKTKTNSRYWSYIPFQPLSQRRLKNGLRISAMKAKGIAESCCFIRAAKCLRVLMLPKLKRLHKPYVVTTQEVYSIGYFPYLRSSVRTDNPNKFNFLSSSTINGLIAGIHTTIIGPLGEGKMFIANWYRHNALSCMELVGCADAIRVFSEHTSSSTFSNSYRIVVNDNFVLRFKRYQSLSAFQVLTAQERLHL